MPVQLKSDAAKAVEITYFNEQPPVLSIQQAIEVQRRTGKKLIRKRYSNKFGQRKSENAFPKF